MDGLLLDSEQEWQKMERDFGKNHGIMITPELQKQTLGLKTMEMILYWYNYKPWPNPDFKKSEAEIEEAMRQFYITAAPLMKGSLEILEFFKNKGFRLALASSSQMMLINTFLGKFRLHNFFEVKHSAEFEEYGKPHPGVYITTARLLNLPPSACLAFEDSFNGLLAAKSAMMKAVAVPDVHHFNDPRFAIADLKVKSLDAFGDKEMTMLTTNE